MLAPTPIHALPRPPWSRRRSTLSACSRGADERHGRLGRRSSHLGRLRKAAGPGGAPSRHRRAAGAAEQKPSAVRPHLVPLGARQPGPPRPAQRRRLADADGEGRRSQDPRRCARVCSRSSPGWWKRIPACASPSPRPVPKPISSPASRWPCSGDVSDPPGRAPRNRIHPSLQRRIRTSRWRSSLNRPACPRRSMLPPDAPTDTLRKKGG